MRFKEFLTEATSGRQKWEKYFADDEIMTKIKNDAFVYDIHGKKIPNMLIKAGEKIIVPVEKKYNPKMLIIWNDEEYRISIENIDKPISVIDKLQLKPDVFSIVGEFKAQTYKKEVLKLIKSSDVSDNIKIYLTELVKNSYGEANHKKLKQAFDVIKSDKKIINIVNKDFLEILGPVIASEQLGLSDSSKFLFPFEGNNALFDFKIIEKENEYMFSSKSGRIKQSNTIKVPEIYSKVVNIKNFRRKYKNEIKVLEIITNTAVKDTPIKLAEFLNSEYNTKFKIKNPKDLAELSSIERKILIFINEKMNFVELINYAIPELIIVKLKIDDDGGLAEPVIDFAQKLSKAKLRSKNSPGHYIDRIGFQV